MAAAQIGQQVQHLRTDADIEGADGLVQYDQRRAGDERAGDGDALALAAAEFMDVFAPVGGGQADLFQRLIHLCAPVRGAAGQVEGFGDQLFHPPAGVEAAERVLKDHLHPGAQGARHPASCRDLLSVKVDRAVLKRFQPEDRAGQGGLAAAAFADEADAFALRDGQAGAVHRPEPFALGQAVVADRALHLQQRAAAGGDLWRAVGRGLKQRLRIRVGLSAKDGFGGAGFDDTARLHDRDMIGHSGDDGQIMGDQQQRHTLFANQPGQQFQDLRLCGHVQRSGRFVRDQQVGPMGDGQRDGDALALAARQFVRVEVERKARRGQADPIQKRAGLRPRPGARHAAVDQQGFGHLIADAHQRVERGCRFLENHPDAAAADGAHGTLGQVQQVLAVQQHLTRRPRGARQQPHDRQRRQRLAAAGFAHQPGDLARCQIQRDIAQEGDIRQRDRQVAKADHRRALSLGSSASRSPSPSRFRPSTVSRMARPGKTATWGARVIMVWASASIRPQLGVGGCAPRPT